MSKKTVSPKWTAERVGRYVANPGLRSKVPTNLLPQKYRDMRQQQARAAAPLVPGSAITYGDALRRRKDAETLQFGADPIGRAQQNERNVAGYWDEYQRQLADHRARVEGYGTDAQAQMGQLVSAAGRQPTDVSGMSQENQAVASQAAGVRGQLAASQGAMITDRSRAANTFASLLDANGYGASAQARSQAARGTEDVRSKVGAFRNQYMTDLRDSESKNVLATALAQGKSATQLAQLQAKLAASDRNNQRDNATRRYTADLSASTAAAKAAAGQTTKPDWLSQGQQNTFTENVRDAMSAVKQYRAITKGMSPSAGRHRLAMLLTQGVPASKASDGTKVAAIPKVSNQLALTAALDLVLDGHLSPATIKKMHAAKYTAAGVKALGPSSTRVGAAAKRATDTVAAIGQQLGG